jgi:calcium-dependent protein kinase
MGCSQAKIPSSNLFPEDNLSAKTDRKQRSLKVNVVVENVNRNFYDFYDVNKHAILGTGVNGNVCECIHKATKLKYALKTLNKYRIKPEKLKQLREEINIMSTLDHPNIVRLHEYFETRNEIKLIMELCEGGELLDRLHSQKGHHYNESVARKYIRTMCGAISYCHKQHIVHRDLKLENFLFETKESDSLVKLIDFGLSQHFNEDEKLSRAVGTPYYVAPEVLNGCYDEKCDVWSIGVITYMVKSITFL